MEMLNFLEPPKITKGSLAFKDFSYPIDLQRLQQVMVLKKLVFVWLEERWCFKLNPIESLFLTKSFSSVKRQIFVKGSLTGIQEDGCQDIPEVSVSTLKELEKVRLKRG